MLVADLGTRRSPRVRPTTAANSQVHERDPAQRRAQVPASTAMRRSVSSTSTTGRNSSGDGKTRTKPVAVARERVQAGPNRETPAVVAAASARRKRERDDAGETTRTVSPAALPRFSSVGVGSVWSPRAAAAAQSSPNALAHSGRAAPPPPQLAPPPRALAGPPLPQPTLPFLLSHLSLERTFAPATVTPAVPAQPFDFPSPPPPPAPTYRLLHPFHHTQPHVTLTPKRPSVGPHPHLVVRTKKRKLFHRFFRSESLLAGPSHPGPNRLSPHVPTHDPGKKLPTWWPSVSRSMGEGRESRLGPAECLWVGEGDNWLSRLQLRFGGVPATGASGAKALVPIAGRDEAAAGAGGAGTVVVAARTRSGGVPRGGRLRSVSSPPTFNQAGHHHHAPGAGVPGSPPLKQHLLAVLRMRLSEGGSSSRGGEAGLRFKKWVVWNAWMKRTNVVSEDEDDLVEGSDVSDDLEHERDSDHLPGDWQAETLVSAHTATPSAGIASLPLVLDAASLAVASSSSPHSPTPMDIDLPSPPPRPVSPNHLSNTGIPSPSPDPVMVQQDLSRALGVDSSAESSSSHRAESELVAPTPARPSFRRASSLPSGPVSGTAAGPATEPAPPATPGSNGTGGAAPPVVEQVSPRPEHERRGGRRDDARAKPIACEA